MRFDLTAVDPANAVVAVELDAADEAGARDAARQRGYAVLSIRRKGIRLAARERFDTLLFSIELLALLDAGLNVVEALQTLAEKQLRGESRRILAELFEGLQRGESLSKAVERFPEVFGPLYVATLRSSEQTGDVTEALSRYVAYREEFDRVRKRIVASLLYPAILIVAGTLVFGFLMLYVVPRFARVYEEISVDLPFFSALLLTTGRWIGNHGVLILVLAGSAAGAAAYLLAQQRFRTRALEHLWRLPALGERMRVYQLARFYRTASMLLRAGIPVVQTLRMVTDLLPPALRGGLARAVAALEDGKALSAALTSAGLTTPVATRMLAVGERSGRMGELMDRIARFYDEETARFVDAFTRVFEPLLMAALGIGVGLVVVLMYMPVFELAGSIR